MVETDNPTMNESTETGTQLTPWPKRIFAITLFVEDLEAAKRFYQAAFGLPVSFEDASSAVFKFGDVMINLLEVGQAPELIEPAQAAAPEAGSRFVITVPVDDVDAICARLTNVGVKLLNGPMNRPWGPRTASFQDPGGHIWEIAS